MATEPDVRRVAWRFAAWLFILAAPALETVWSAEPDLPAAEWLFLQNPSVRLGVKLSSGGAIGWFSTAGGENLINAYDHGRLLQQSYYGDPDGSVWAGKPWTWNPVQGGDYQGRPSRVLEVKATSRELYLQMVPRHWASGEELPDVKLEEWISLPDGPLAKIRFRMRYQGTKAHTQHDQEIPALFVDRSLGTLVTYDEMLPWTGQPPRRLQPGFPNEYLTWTEPWAAWVNEQDDGLGIYVPQATRLTMYRVGEPGQKGACSYCAPLIRFAVTPGMVFEYEAWLTAGRLTEIRERFQRLHAAAHPPP